MGRRDSYFVEYFDGVPTVLHLVRMPDIMEKGFKGQAKAFNNYNDNEAERVAEDHTSGRNEVYHFFYRNSEWDWNSNKEFFGKFMEGKTEDEILDHLIAARTA